MIDYALALCYGIIVSRDKLEELQEKLTDDEYDEMLDNYAHCINSWTGDDYFIGITEYLTHETTDFVYSVSNLSTPTEDNEDLIGFKKFFNDHDLWKLIDWNPKLMLINFCY